MFCSYRTYLNRQQDMIVEWHASEVRERIQEEKKEKK